MTLNIYTISHPIIQFLASSIINQNTEQNVYEKNCQYIGLLFIYEVLRKYTKIEELYIKKMYSTKNFYLINLQTKFYIFTDLSKNYKMVTEIKILLPNIEIIHIEYRNNDTMNKNTENNIKHIKIKYSNIKIFILDEIVNNEQIIKIIKYLETQTKISLNNIILACIACYDDILHKLDNIYPQLKVYTTKIVYRHKQINNN
uniref:Uracil phosphoribosyltransferase n=1 Tax=Bostrychia tenella TaxID=324755 RepID=A0A1Z1M5K2_9FLOR|nr:uracil phosphoribosyltransferase [Bostrychia tenella]ARW61347.1 uracil phosphoribosyltransferase [Bostrychia tenella]